jgi:SAM-dependent methyltransferase
VAIAADAQSEGVEAIMTTTKGSAQRHAAVWGVRAEDWANHQEKVVDPLYEGVLARFEVGPATRLLDVGCGAGGFLVKAKARGASIKGLDATPELVAIAKRRLPGSDIGQGELEELPFGEGEFDLVTGFNAFQYAADPVHALEEARRVLRPGGAVIVATWGRPEDCEGAGVIWALKPLLPPPSPTKPPSGGPFCLTEEAPLRAYVAEAGLDAALVEYVSCPFVYASDADALRALLSGGPLVAAINNSGEEKVRAAVLGAIAPYRTTAGGYRLENKFRYVVARRLKE